MSVLGSSISPIDDRSEIDRNALWTDSFGIIKIVHWIKPSEEPLGKTHEIAPYKWCTGILYPYFTSHPACGLIRLRVLWLGIGPVAPGRTRRQVHSWAKPLAERRLTRLLGRLGS